MLVDGARATLAAVGFAIPLVLPVAVVLAAVLVWQRRRPPAAPANEAHP